MAVEALVEELERGGVSFVVNGDELRLRTPVDRVPASEVIAELRQQKQAVLAYLRRTQTCRG